MMRRLLIAVLLMMLAGVCYADAHTLSVTGPFSSTASWTGGSKPAAGDTITQNAGVTTTYDESTTTEYGAMTLNGTAFNFDNTKSTKLCMGDATITVSANTTFSIGTSAGIIPSAYTAELYWNTTSDNSKGLTVTSGGVLNVYGDPAYYGSDEDAEMATNWTTSNVIYVGGDFTAKWVAGQYLLLHKFTTYSNYNTDVTLCKIASMGAYSGGNTEITIQNIDGSAIANPSATHYAGGYVLNVSRNVIVGKLGAVETIGNTNTNRPFLTISQASLQPMRINLHNTRFVGLYRLNSSYSYNVISTKCVFCNNYYGIYGLRNINFDAIFHSSGVGAVGACSGIISGYIPATVVGITSSGNLSVTAKAYSVGTYLSLVDSAVISGDVFSVATPTGGGVSATVFTGGVGYKGSTACANINGDYVFQPYNPSLLFKGGTVASSILFSNRGVINLCRHSLFTCNVNGSSNSHVEYQCYGTNTRTTSVTRTGGSPTSIQCTPLSNAGASPNHIVLCEWEEYNVPASAQTRFVYIYGTGWTYPLTAAECYLEAEYFNSASAFTTAIAASTDTLAADSTWETMTVNFVPARVERVKYRVVLAKYKAASILYLDNALYLSVQAKYEGQWTDGRSVLAPVIRTGTGR